MALAWRIVKARRAETAFAGEGPRFYGGQWTPVGRPAVYVSSTLSLAMLELLVHLRDVRPLAAYAAFQVTIPDKLIEDVAGSALPSRWFAFPAPPELQTLGDAWLASERSAALRVPSAIVRVEFNYILSPKHRDFSRIVIGQQQALVLDSRLR